MQLLVSKYNCILNAMSSYYFAIFAIAKRCSAEIWI